MRIKWAVLPLKRHSSPYQASQGIVLVIPSFIHLLDSTHKRSNPFTMGKPESTMDYVIVTLPIIIIILGLFGNAFSAAVLLRKRFRCRSITVYLLALSLLDSIFLVSSAPLAWAIDILFGVKYQSLSGMGCAVSMYILNASRAMSAWVLVVLTVERMLVMSIPHLAQQFTSRKRALISTLVVMLVVGAIYSYSFFVFDLYPYGKNCYWKIEMETEGTHLIITVFDFLFYIIIPSSIMATCNSSLLFFLYYSREVRQRGEADHKHIAVTIVLVTTAFIVLTTPMCVQNIIYLAGVKLVQPKYLFTVFYSLDLLNHAINCVLYSISGPSFREEIKSMCGCCGKKNKEGRSKLKLTKSTSLEFNLEKSLV